MLKDKLLALEVKSPIASCALGRAMSEMDKETLAAFTKVMKSDASAKQILEVLAEEGEVGFGITHLRSKRADCFKGTKSCACLNGAKQ
jgi:hypothetical protein